MRNFIKKTALILSITTILSIPATISLASDNTDVKPISVEDRESVKPHAFYNSFTGTVKEINDRQNGLKAVSVESKDGRPANFIISENTYYVENAKIDIGSEITGFYEAGKPMIMIYPPQYSIDIIAVNAEGINFKADKFDSNLLSADKALKLNIGEETEIVWENGTVINWIKKPTPKELSAVLSNRKLIVLYNFTTKSIPAQTTPTKIIVLSQQENPYNEIIVNGKKIDAPSAYLSESDVVMVPLRTIAEALGFDVKWNDELQSITVGKDISLIINKDNYILRNAPIQLEAAPALVESTTFVPLNFFKEIAQMNNASVSEGKIIISKD